MSPEPTHHGAPAAPPAQASLHARADEHMHHAMAADHAMMMEHARGAHWAHFANMSLGFWLITSAFALGLQSPGLQASDVASGTLVVVLATLSVGRSPFWRLWAPWANSLVGVWLLFASSWPQRAPIIALALLGFFLGRQMTAYQLGHVPSLTDPFFGPGTERVLTSKVSRAWPIPDAGLGAVAYMIEFLMGFMGDKRRWRTMPWMVTFFGILVVPLGAVSITLIILQPLSVGEWCTPCLIAAAAMLVMIALTLDEVVAMGQFLMQARREGQSLWRVFWLGGTLRDLPDVRPTHPDVINAKAMVWGVCLPWTLLLSAGVGLWLMFAPAALGSTGVAAHSDHLVGALIVTVAVIALADVGRATRFLNLLLGAWVAASPWLLGGATGASTWSDGLAGCS